MKVRFELATDRLTRLGACADSVDYLSRRASPRKAWELCPLPEWAMWLAIRLPIRPAVVLRAACDVVRWSADRWPDDDLTDLARRLLAVTEGLLAGSTPSHADVELREQASAAWWHAPGSNTEKALEVVVLLHELVSGLRERPEWPHAGASIAGLTYGSAEPTWRTASVLMDDLYCILSSVGSSICDAPEAPTDYDWQRAEIAAVFVKALPYEVIAAAAGLPSEEPDVEGDDDADA